MKKNIFRVVKDENYTVISNIPLKDKSLSLKAKGLLCYILTLPDDWKIYIRELSEHSQDGRDGTASALRELIKKQYVTRQRITELGKFVGYEYSVYEMPAPLFDAIQNAKNEYFSREKPKTAFPNTDKPNTANPSLLNTNLDKILNQQERPEDAHESERWYKAIPIKLANGDDWYLPEYVASQILSTYPHIDLEAELKKMSLWITGNPTRRKTRKGMPRFVTSWINRANDAPKSHVVNPPQDSHRPPQKMIATWGQARRAHEKLLASHGSDVDALTSHLMGEGVVNTQTDLETFAFAYVEASKKLV